MDLHAWKHGCSGIGSCMEACMLGHRVATRVHFEIGRERRQRWKRLIASGVVVARTTSVLWIERTRLNRSRVTCELG